VKTDAHWQKIGMRPHHGVCVPLFSIHTKNSSGIGEFLDLIPLIDWCSSLKLDCIQLLPINDSGPDPSPYNCLSAYALDPVYLSLHALGIEPIHTFKTHQLVMRSEVLALKMELLHTYFQKTFAALSQTTEYQTFLNQNPWLQTYGRFKALKAGFEGRHWRDWPKEAKPAQEKVDFYIFLQFHCYNQMEQVRAHASEQGVFLKGDIPILLSPDSADVWENPSLFHLDLNAGAPPDYYNKLGQNWGFPLFNWEAMRKSGFKWWKDRLKVVEKLYHIYRIDHVVGFFRIWGIEQGKKAAEGSFFPPDQSLWAAQGRELLEMMIDATTLLPMSEDLGTIPKEVYPILKELGICGIKVVRWQAKEGHFIPFSEYEPLSMTTISTHDMDTLELWWKKYPSEVVPFAAFMGWAYHPILSSKQRLQILHAVHHTPSYFHINPLQEYLALFPELVWPNPEDERINVPGTLLPTNWTYRFRPSIEELAEHKELAKSFSEIIN
jgi:4-alpha-glucanotransferase